jgi:hypothetical protein
MRKRTARIAKKSLAYLSYLSSKNYVVLASNIEVMTEDKDEKNLEVKM